MIVVVVEVGFEAESFLLEVDIEVEEMLLKLEQMCAE